MEIIRPSSIDELKLAGKPLKELTGKPDSGFQELSGLKEISEPLKELAKGKGFDELGILKDAFIPIKEIINKDEKKGGSDSNGNDGKSGEKEQSTDSKTDKEKQTDAKGKDNKDHNSKDKDHKDNKNHKDNKDHKDSKSKK